MPDGSIVPDLAARFHPFCDLFPAMERKEFSALVLDIRTRGLQVPIMKMGDLILDGRHRYLACREAGVEPRYEEYNGADPLGYVLGANLLRRHLSPSQRAMVAAKLANMPQGARTDREPSANLQKVSQSKAARLLNVSLRSVADAKKVIERGTTELARRVNRGEIKVSTAAKVSGKPEEQQTQVTGLDPRALRSAVKAALGEREVALPAAKQSITDRLLWREQQADLLRRLAAGERVHDQVDLLDLAEVIEAPCKQLRRELADRISTVLRCLIQLGLATWDRENRVWRKTADRELQEIERLLANFSSLQSTVPAVIGTELADAKEAALKVLHGQRSSYFLFEDGFLKALPPPKLRSKDPYEVDMCAAFAAQKIKLWASKLCLLPSANAIEGHRCSDLCGSIRTPELDLWRRAIRRVLLAAFAPTHRVVPEFEVIETQLLKESLVPLRQYTLCFAYLTPSRQHAASAAWPDGREPAAIDQVVIATSTRRLMASAFELTDLGK